MAEICERCIKCLNRLGLTGLLESFEGECGEDMAIGDEQCCLAVDLMKKQIQDKIELVSRLQEEWEEMLRDLETALHDVGEPVNTIVYLVGFLSEDLKDGEPPSLTDMQYVDRIGTSTLSLRRMVDDISLLISLRRYGDTDESPIGEVFLEGCVDHAEKNVFSVIQSTSGKIEVKGELPTLLGKEVRWVRIFQNLMTNGLRYNTSETPLVEIWHEDGKVLVRDNGIGIPSDKRDAIFSLFVRLKDREHMSTDGTGAGLYMVKRLVEWEGGEISVDDHPSGGTVFTISLPSA